MTVSIINQAGRLLVRTNVCTCSYFNANGLSDNAQAGQSKNLQVQTGVQRRPRPHLVKLFDVQRRSGSSSELRVLRLSLMFSHGICRTTLYDNVQDVYKSRLNDC